MEIYRKAKLAGLISSHFFTINACDERWTDLQKLRPENLGIERLNVRVTGNCGNVFIAPEDSLVSSVFMWKL